MTNVLGLDDFVTESIWMKSRESPISSPILGIYAISSTYFTPVIGKNFPNLTCGYTQPVINFMSTNGSLRPENV